MVFGMSDTPQFWANLNATMQEVSTSLAAAERGQEEAVEKFVDLIGNANRVVVNGAGRSGLALRMTAMRLMHLGREVKVIGDVTTPAVRFGDVMLAASGSGTTGGVVRAAEIAVKAGAKIAVITASPGSRLAKLADALIVVPAPQKQEHRSGKSVQYAGSLFEQDVVLIGDMIFHTLWQRSGISPEELWAFHANIE